MTMRTGADEERSPKYSHVERERRWLVDSARLPAFPREYVLIEDRYLSGTRFRLRRMTNSETGEIALKFAKKYRTADAKARPMINVYLDEAEFAVFQSMPGRSIDKRRFVIGGFSLDVFDGPHAGLVLAEQEAPDALTLDAIETPDWAIREVTDDQRFEGGTLVGLSACEIAVLLKDATP